jgi:hypothetical protein
MYLLFCFSIKIQTLASNAQRVIFATVRHFGYIRPLYQEAPLPACTFVHRNRKDGRAACRSIPKEDRWSNNSPDRIQKRGLPVVTSIDEFRGVVLLTKYTRIRYVNNTYSSLAGLDINRTNLLFTEIDSTFSSLNVLELIFVVDLL